MDDSLDIRLTLGSRECDATDTSTRQRISVGTYDRLLAQYYLQDVVCQEIEIKQK
jgi:hypothetical protein